VTVLFHILHDERSGGLSYLLAEAVSGDAALIDPHSRDLPVWRALLDERRCRLRWVLRTHQHDAQSPREPVALACLGVPVVQGESAPGATIASDGARLPLGEGAVAVLSTPGHTPSCLSFQWQDRVFCGGLMVVDACPHQPHPADPAALWDSVTQRIFTLPDETLLFAGHDRRAQAVSTVLAQRRWHPFFARLTRDAFLARMAAMP